MFQLWPPVESKKGYLISLFQAGKMSFPESICLRVNGWTPFSYWEFCATAIARLVSGSCDRAAIPASVCDVGGELHMDQFWALSRMGSGDLAVWEIVHNDLETIAKTQGNPESWWQDAPVCGDDEQPWQCVTERAARQWLLRVDALVKGRMSPAQEESFSGHSLTLTPPLQIGNVGRVIVHAPPMSRPFAFDVSLRAAAPRDYLKSWVESLSRFTDPTGSSVRVGLIADARRLDDSDCPLCLCRSGERIWVEFNKTNVLRSDLSDSRLNLALSPDDVWEWVYAAQTVLNRLDGIDADDGYG